MDLVLLATKENILKAITQKQSCVLFLIFHNFSQCLGNRAAAGAVEDGSPVNDLDRPGGLTAQVTERRLKPSYNGEFSKKMLPRRFQSLHDLIHV